ncbi:MAG: UV DNA damage repair endonuclease UvsE [Bacilli bacterium]|nr:UV DNA damage repair endonuclease UvsE [Bacilli bacterium]MDD4282736.1 UV DNA damage repair endonuclease UvsE [Bacilli bacterium]MDD4718999.1 UV DNA damage repair endonuclease UvsE [Bacilli bacterium]
MNIGYACLILGDANISYKNCTKKNATYDNLVKIIDHNLSSLEKAIDYNIKNNIKLFRISSTIIPFGSSDINTVKWWDLFEQKLTSIGKKIKDNNIRVSMHPGQYSVLNSPKSSIVEKTINDLDYHTKFLKSLNTDKTHKIILHVGGIYNNKNAAITRFIDNFNKLHPDIKERLVIENDDKSYNIQDVLKIHKHTNIPVVFDNLHHSINHNDLRDDLYWILKCIKTWSKDGSRTKVHYSEQDINKQRGSHSKTIDINIFDGYYSSVKKLDLDIMLEVKDKNLSAIKCINTFILNDNKLLEKEWNKYKYNVLEKSQVKYQEINRLLNNKTDYNPKEFYNLLEEAINLNENKINSIKALNHIWKYFQDITTNKEKEKILKCIKDYQKNKISLLKIKRLLYKLAVIYNIESLIDSYYFIF